MKIAIVGAGKLGIRVASTLLNGDHAVTLIDSNDEVLQKMNTHLDIMTVNANAKQIKMLKRIGISSYDCLIAVTGGDDTNLVIASLAKKLGCKKVIARLTEPENMSQLGFIRDHFGIDHIVTPDLAITIEIYKYLAEKYTLSNGIFSSGKISLLEFKTKKYPQLENVSMIDFHKILPNMLVVGISRNGKFIIPHGTDTILAGDILYVVGEKGPIQELSKKVYERGKYTNLQKVMILGGGKTGFFLAQRLADFGAAVKLVEKSKDRCYYLSTHLNNVMVLHGDATDLSLLEEEGLDSMDAVVAVTGFDEDNLLLALTAKRHGVEDVISKVSRASYVEIISSMGVDMALNPLDISTSNIIRQVQDDKKIISSQLLQGQAELMEVFASSHMDNLMNRPLKDLKLPDSVIIAAINRGTEVIIPNGNTVIREGDRVMMLGLLSDMDNIEKLLKDNSKFGFFKKKK